MVATTKYPAFASSTTVSRPKPLELPVTTATLLLSMRWNCSSPRNGEHGGHEARRERSRNSLCDLMCCLRDLRVRRSQFANQLSLREHSRFEFHLENSPRSDEPRMAKEKKTASDKIAPAKGKLGIMIPGMGAVATTFVAGVEAVRKGHAKPIGSMTQMGTVRLGKRTEGRTPKVKEFVPLTGLNDLVFTGWDIFEDDMYTAASKAGVIEKDLLDKVKPFLQSVKPRQAVFDRHYVKKLDGHNVKKGK